MARLILTYAQLQALVENLTTRAPKTTFVVAGESYPASKVVALAKSVLAARGAISTSKGDWLRARQQAVPVENGAAPILAVVRATLVSMLSNDPGAMAQLAVAPRKKASTPTPEERMVAAAKVRAPREARGTKSKKALSKVKGNVTGITVTTVTAPVASPVTSASATPSAAPVANDVVAAAASPPGAPTIPASIAGAVVAPTVIGH